MKYIKSVDGKDYYLFTPSLTRQYFNKEEEWTKHRKLLSHKLHMLLYYIRGGYSILYMMDGEEIAAYLVFTRAGRTVIEGTTKEDIFTIFVTTHPKYRRQGLATKIVHELLTGINLKFRTAYKTIVDWNTRSRLAAFANGYVEQYPGKKSKYLKTIQRVEKSKWKLYSYQNKNTD